MFDSLLDRGYFSDATERDLFRSVCGELLGSGMSREVWSCALDERFVVKIERRDYFQNVVEWETWNDAKDMGNGSEKFLAPIKSISPNGRVLVMWRTEPAKKLPEKMPVFLSDFKPTNYGMLGKRVVCHDYGTNLMCNSGLSTRMRKVSWTDE